MGAVWDLVPGRSATEALCLLAMHHIEADTGHDLHIGCVEVQEVAVLTGMATATAGSALRSLAKAGHLETVPYLATASNGRPCARVGYRLEATS